MNDGLVGLLLQAEAAPFDSSFFLMMGSVFLIFYLLVIRPESTKRKAHEASIKAAEKGDQIVTSGGIQGLITGTTDDLVTVEIAVLKSGERVRIKVQRSAISNIVKAAEKSDKKGSDS